MEKTTPIVKVAESQMAVTAKEFKTGSKGFYAYGKTVIDGKMYQVSCTIVEIGSKQK